MTIYLRKQRGRLSKENEKRGKARKISLYLVCHYGAGQKREYEHLKLYLYEKPKTALERDHNKETMKLAEAIKAKRILDAQSTAHGFVSNVKTKIGFLVFFKGLTDNKFDSDGNYGNWLSTYRHLHDFLKGKDIPLEQVDDRFLEAFKEYLQTCKTRKGRAIVFTHFHHPR